MNSARWTPILPLEQPSPLSLGSYPAPPIECFRGAHRLVTFTRMLHLKIGPGFSFHTLRFSDPGTLPDARRLATHLATHIRHLAYFLKSFRAGRHMPDGSHYGTSA